MPPEASLSATIAGHLGALPLRQGIARAARASEQVARLACASDGRRSLERVGIRQPERCQRHRIAHVVPEVFEGPGSDLVGVLLERRRACRAAPPGPEACPARTISRRCTLAMVGAVSPEPMMARIRGHSRRPTGPSCVHPVMVAAKSTSDRAQFAPGTAHGGHGPRAGTTPRRHEGSPGQRLSTPALRAALRAGSSTSGSANRNSTGRRIGGIGLRRVVLPELTQDGHVVLQAEPRLRRYRPRAPGSWPACPRCRSRASPDAPAGSMSRAAVTGVPRRSGGASAASACSQSGSIAESSMVPPSTATTPRTSVGWRDGQLHDHVAAPGLPDHDGRLDVHLVDDRAPGPWSACAKS